MEEENYKKQQKTVGSTKTKVRKIDTNLAKRGK
jgi:hypothetical protein